MSLLPRLRRYWLPGVLLALIAAILAMVWQTIFVELARMKEEAIEDARRDTRNIVRSLAEHAERTIGQIEMVLLEVADRRARGEPIDLSAIGSRTPSLSEVIRFVSILDRDGIVVAGTVPGTTGQSFADRAHFREIRQSKAKGVAIGRPFVRRAVAEWAIPFAVRLETADGAFDGAVTTAIPSDYFVKFYTTIDLGRYGAAAIVSPDGTVYARQAGAIQGIGQGIGQTYPNLDVLQHTGAFRKHTFTGTSAIDGTKRIVSFERLDRFPVIVFAAKAEADVLAAFEQDRAVLLGQGWLLTALFLALAALLLAAFTKHRRIERDRERLRFALEGAHDGLWEWTAGTDEFFVGPRVRAILRLPPSDAPMRRSDWWENIHPEDREKVRRALDAHLSGMSDAYEAEYRVKTGAGTWIWISSRGRVVKRSNGRPIRMVGAFTDIDARRRAEAAAAEAVADLKASETRFRAIFDSSFQMAGLLAPDGTLLQANATALSFAGIEAGGVEGRAFWEAPWWEAERADLARLRQGVARARSGEVARFETIMRRGTGECVTVDLSFKPIRGNDGETTLIVAEARDISERKVQEQELRAAKEAAESATRAKSDFLATISHEIRTPLNGIIGYTEILLDDSHLTPAQRDLAGRIQSSGAALLVIVNSVLDFAEIEAGQMQIDRHAFPLAPLIGECIGMTQALAEKKNLAAAAAVAPGLPAFVFGDQNRLRQVLLNLLGNAVKFTSSGSITLSVAAEAGCDAVRPKLRFSVADTGIGIAPEDMPALFQRFSQVDSSVRRRFGGTGLGLAISKRLAELMGGEIGASSRVGQGSTFWFTAVLPEAPRIVSGAAPPRSARRCLTAKILLVEDLDLNRDLARAILESAGHEVEIVDCGADAVMAVQAFPYDLVLMDVHMPGMDGISATRRIRELPMPAREVPVVAMTANVLADQVEAMRQAGMDDHIGKPFRRDDLLDAVARWFAKGRALRAGWDRGEPSAPLAPVTLDRAVLDELVQTLGRERIARLLDQLRVMIEQAFPDASAGGSEGGALAGEAHKLVSAAGMAGFLELSQASRALEAACRAGGDLEEPLAAARAAGARVLASIAALGRELRAEAA